MSVRTKENVQELFRRRFEQTKRYIGATGADVPITVFVGTWTDEQVYELEPEDNDDKYVQMGKVLAEAKAMEAQYVMELGESWLLKPQDPEMTPAEWEREMKEQLTRWGTLENVPSRCEALSGHLRFADGSSLSLLAEITREGGKKTVLETQETALLRSAFLPQWNQA